MSPLQERLAELRAKVRQLLWLYGLSWLTAVLLGTLLLVGWTDWLLHLDDAGVRLILGLSILAIVGYVAYRRLIAPLRVPLSDIDLALRIERRFPQFRDSFASTIQFLEANQDPALGAPALQKRVIEKTLKQTKFIDFEDVVQSKPVQRIAWTALLVCITTAFVVGFNQVEAATALKRLVFPFGSHPWPRRVRLQFVNQELVALVPDPDDPLRIARGDTFELTAVNLNDRGRMPASVQLEFKHPDGSITRESMQRITIKHSATPDREAAFSSLIVKTPFEFRAIGGDDDSMEWFPLEVVPPPVAESLNVTLTPPKYTRRPTVKLPTGAGHIEALVGTVVNIQATANKPLGKSLLRVKDKEQFPLKLSEDGRQLAGSFTIKESGVYSYWLDLRDTQNFGNSDAPRYEIRATQDTVPDIYIDQPATDIQVTPTAEVPVKFIARDDLGLVAIHMQYTTQATEAAELTPQVEIPLVTLPKRPKQHSQEYVWKLESLALKPGMKVQFHGEATDEFDLAAPHIGRSLARTLTVISPEDKTQELNTRQAGLLNQLLLLKKQESVIATQTGDLKQQLEKAGALRPEDLDLLQRIEGQQRNVASTLQNPQDGILARTTEILNELEQNHLESPDTKRRLEQIKLELQRLTQGHLPQIEEHLTQARKEVTGSESRGGNVEPTPMPGDATPLPMATENPTGPQSTDPPKTDPATGDLPTPAPPENGDPASPGTEEGKPAPINPAKSNPDTIKPGATDPTQPMPPGEKQPDETRPSTDPTGKPALETDAASDPTAPKKPERIPEQPRAGASTAEQALHRAQFHEQTVTETLEDLLTELSQWHDEREATAGLQEIRKEQDKVAQETAELGQKTVTKSLQELKPQEQADLAKQAGRQTQAAQQVDQLQRKLGDIVQKLAEQDPDAAGRLQEVLDQLKQDNLAGQMRDAARQVGENQIGQASQTQQQISKNLEKLEGILKNEATSDLESLVKQIDQVEAELSKLQEEQEELRKQTAEAEQQPEPTLKEQQLEELQKKQEELQRKAEQLARKLERLKLDGPAQAAQRAAERMQQAREELTKEGENQADQQEQEALADLDQARRELAQERKQIEESLAQEQLEKVSDEIKALTERQRAVVSDIKRLDEAHQAKGNWTRAQLKTLRDLSDSQRGLQGETIGLSEKLSAAKIFALAAKGAARNMQQTATKLDEKETGATTQILAQAALQRFLDLIDAMKPEKPKPPEGQPETEQQPANNGGGEQKPPGVDPATVIAELKMLRSMQVDLNTRMEVLAEKRDQGLPLTAAELEEVKTLGQEQGDLAELTAKFLETFDPQGQGKPAAAVP